ncbi:MAG: TonB-dependent receptor [Deltaproteobacteria bacterium]|nr:TonB-dependent receptor [Deltaproteobacteria bacterium]
MRTFTIAGFRGANSLGRLGRAAAVLAWLSPGLALAQETSPPPPPRGTIEEITVTAQKREQSAQDVGISLTAVTGDELERGGFASAQEVTALAAGVSTIQPNGEANYAVGMRGVANSDFTANVESPVAVYVDEVYISQMSGTGFMLFDMERVEILRGPQGTLFGRNATGGLAHFVTRKPARELDGYARLTGGENSQIKVEGAVGGGGDLLSARLSFSGHWNDGYIENRLNDSDLNNANDKAWRAQVLFTPNEDFSLLLNVRGSDQLIRTGFFEHVTALATDADGNEVGGVLTPNLPNTVLGGYRDDDGDVFAGAYNDPGHNDLETTGATATINWNFGNVTLTSITDYQSVERDYIEDSDASPVRLFNFFLTTDAEQISQELRLAGGRDRLNWVAGFYWLDIDVDDSNGGESEDFAGALAPLATLRAGENLAAPALSGLDNPYTTETTSWSLFGQVEYDLTETLTAVGGFRWIQDDKEHKYTANLVDFDPSVQRSNDNPIYQGTFGSYEGERDDGVWSARVVLNWQPSAELLVFGGWNRGVKSGGFNAPIFPFFDASNNYNDATFNYRPEELDAYEVGFKSTLAAGRVQLNASAYYYDYSDYQAFTFVGLDAITRNAEASSQGFEIEAVARPIEGLTLRVGAAYNDIEVDLGNNTPKTTSVQSPEWNVNALLRYEWKLFGGAMSLQVDGDYRSEHFFALTRLPAVTEDGYTVANLSIGWESLDGQWGVRGFVRNFTDEEYLVQVFDLSTTAAFGMVEQYYGRPRWAGVNLTYRF